MPMSFSESFVIKSRHAPKKRLSRRGKFFRNIGLWRWQFRNLGNRLTGFPVEDKNLCPLGQDDDHFTQRAIDRDVRQSGL